MKRIILMLSLSLAALLGLSACGFPLRHTEVRGSGGLITEVRRVSGFNQIDLSGIGTLIIEQGSTETLHISADENILPYLESRVSGRTLHLGVEEFVNVRPNQEVIYRLTVKDIESLEASGLGNIEIKALRAWQLQLEISGSGSIQIGDLQADTLYLDISGLGNVKVAGKVDVQNIEISGAGNYMAGDLTSRSAQIEISGSGNAQVWATDVLGVVISGMGSLDYYGSPSLNTGTSGLGKIHSLGDK